MALAAKAMKAMPAMKARTAAENARVCAIARSAKAKKKEEEEAKETNNVSEGSEQKKKKRVRDMPPNTRDGIVSVKRPVCLSLREKIQAWALWASYWEKHGVMVHSDDRPASPCACGRRSGYLREVYGAPWTTRVS